MRGIFLFLCWGAFLLLIQNIVYSQNNIDSFLILSKHSEGKEKIDILNQLSIVYRLNSLNRSIEFADKAIRLLQKNNYDFGDGEAYKKQGDCPISST